MNIDVVVVTYESADHLAPCLGALPADLRVIVVDNASHDRSAAVARDLGAEVIANDANIGFARAANQGAAGGEAELILFLNPDAVLSADGLRRLAISLNASPDVGIVGARLRQPDGTCERASWPYPSARRSWLEALGLHRLVPERGPQFVPGTCLLVRRDLFDSLGGFDERFWFYGEDADLGWRAHAAGWSSHVAEGAVAEHIGGASGERVPEIAFEHFQRGAEHFVMKHGGRRALVSHRLALLVGSVVRVPLLAMAGRRRRVRTRRRIISRLLRTLVSQPTRVAGGDLLPPTKGASQLIVCSLEDWDEVWRRNQFLVRDLLKLDPELRVLFVEPPRDFLHEVVTRRWRPRMPTLRRLETYDRVWVLKPTKPLPRLVGPFADRSLANQVARAALVLGFDQPTLWINNLSYATLVESSSWPIVYDITDDWLRAKTSARERRQRMNREQSVLERADAVVVCSAELLNTKVPRGHATLIPNAADTEHLRRPVPRPPDLPPAPTAVYVGTLHDERLDIGLLEELADAQPALHVVLVGPDQLSAAARRSLTSRANLRILGRRDHAVVPGYLQHADVLIVPHLVSPFTESLDPIKAYECLAVGKPTVATPVAGFRALGPPVHVVPASQFSEEVRRRVDDRAAPVIEAVPSWSDRAGEFAEVLTAARRRRSSSVIEERRLRVVYIDHCSLLSGAELALSRLLPALTTVDAHVVLADGGPIAPLLEQVGARVTVLPLSERSRLLPRGRVRPGQLPFSVGVDMARYVLRLRRLLRELHPDLVHTNSLKAGFYGSLAARLAGIPVVWHMRDRAAPDYLPRPAVWLIRAAVRVLPNAVIANSKATAATLKLGAGRGQVVPSPVVYDVVEPPHQRLSDLNGHLYVGMVGRIAPWKGQDVFLRAFSQAFPDGPEEAVVVGAPLFGEEDYERQLRALSLDLGIDQRVTFTGFVSNPRQLISEFDVLVHASIIPEPFGQVVVEGMAAGCPVVAVDAGGPAEIVTHERDGLLYPPGDVAVLAGMLKRLAADPELRTRLGTAGRHRAPRLRAAGGRRSGDGDLPTPLGFEAVRRLPGRRAIMGRLRARVIGLVSRRVVVGPRAKVGKGCRFIVERRSRIEIGARAEIDDGTTLAAYGDGVVRLGADSFLGHHCTVAARERVEIGRGARLAELVSVRDHDHDPAFPPSSPNVLVEAVSVGDHAWLASKVTVLRGSTIGERSVVGANAVVRGHIPAGVIAAGIPAEVVRPIGATEPTPDLP